MPRIVDTAKRRSDIAEAAIRILARGGTSALTLRSLAEEMKGSITLITHFYANRSDLFSAIMEGLSEEYDRKVEKISADPDPAERLRLLLEWLLPLTARDRQREAVRLALNTMRGDETVEQFFQLIELRMRHILTTFLAPLVPPAAVLPAVDLLRALINGLTLSAIEHPKMWTRRRQIATVNLALVALRIDPPVHIG